MRAADASAKIANSPSVDVQAFSSQTMRSPSSVRNGSTLSIVRECGATRSASPPVAIASRLGAELLPDAADDPVHLAREAVHEAGLEAADRRLPDHRRRRCVVDLHEPGRTGEQRLHGRLDSRREDTADVLALGRDDVEVRRGAEVDHDDRGAVALLGRDRVHDAVRADLARIVVANRDAGLDARADDEQRGVRPLPCERLPLADQHRDGRGKADPVDVVEVEQAAQQDAELVGGRGALGGQPPVVRQLGVRVQTERGLRVADVDGEEHRAQVNQSSCGWGVVESEARCLGGRVAA